MRSLESTFLDLSKVAKIKQRIAKGTALPIKSKSLTTTSNLTPPLLRE